MRILDVSPRVVFPPSRGSGVRTYNILRHLSARHEIRQFSYARPAERPNVRSERAVWITPSYLEYRFFSGIGTAVSELGERTWVSAPVLSGVALRLVRPKLLREWLRWADVTLVEFPWLFELCRREHPSGRFVLATHNVEAPKFRSYAAAVGRPWTTAPWVRFIEHVERRAVAAAELTLAVSAADRDALVDRYGADPDRVIVVPNGADTAKYQPADRDSRRRAKRRLGLPDKPTVIYAASNVPPNEVGLRWIRRLAERTGRFTFLVLGLVAKPEVNGSLIATGLVDDPAYYVQAADIAICPVEYGGGTKIKLLESLAAGLPTVAFAEALHGLTARDQEHVMVVDKSEEALLAALERIVGDPALADRLGRSGRRLVCDHHDWGAIAERVDAALRRLTPAPRSSRIVERAVSGG